MLNIHTCHWWDVLVGYDSIWNKLLFDFIPEDQAAEPKSQAGLQMKITGCQRVNGNLRRAIWCSASWRKKEEWDVKWGERDGKGKKRLGPYSSSEKNILQVLSLPHCSAVINGSLTMLSPFLIFPHTLSLPFLSSLSCFFPSAHLSGAKQQKMPIQDSCN